jgi:hypothetical protein
MTRGVLRDRVGLETAPSKDGNGKIEKKQVYDAVIYQGVQYPVHVEFKQVTTITNGKVTNELIRVR